MMNTWEKRPKLKMSNNMIDYVAAIASWVCKFQCQGTNNESKTKRAILQLQLKRNRTCRWNCKVRAVPKKSVHRYELKWFSINWVSLHASCLQMRGTFTLNLGQTVVVRCSLFMPIGYIMELTLTLDRLELDDKVSHFEQNWFSLHLASKQASKR